ncbi:MAG: NAD(P)/FAD-dependent oxidoreductase [Ardenticatenaceae bacterium]|nr:NAD(P)/FAD-dependent oxidoreductase [Ardenticatenaceae bacterium]
MAAHQIVILGGGVGGTLGANLLARKLSSKQAQITVVSASGRHVYQPGWLYVPFGWEKPENLERSERRLLSKRVRLLIERAEGIDPDTQRIHLADGQALPYDSLVIATGSRLAPEAVPGFSEAAQHFYSAEAALGLRQKLYAFQGGHIVIGVADIPYKCPPAPLEFTFLLDYDLHQRGLRDKTRISYLSPISRVFTIETVSEYVTPMFEERGIESQIFFNTETIDPDTREIQSLEGDSINYDLLVMVPPHRGAQVVVDSGLGDEQGWLPTDRETLVSKAHPNIYGLGDATDLPVSKSGSAAHFEAKIVANRIAAAIKDEELTNSHYDGHVLCFIETGYNQATQLVFDYNHPPYPPRPSPFYHYEKTVFNQVYWYLVPRGIV